MYLFLNFAFPTENWGQGSFNLYTSNDVLLQYAHAGGFEFELL